MRMVKEIQWMLEREREKKIKAEERAGLVLAAKKKKKSLFQESE